MRCFHGTRSTVPSGNSWLSRSPPPCIALRAVVCAICLLHVRVGVCVLYMHVHVCLRVQQDPRSNRPFVIFCDQRWGFFEFFNHTHFIIFFERKVIFGGEVFGVVLGQVTTPKPHAKNAMPNCVTCNGRRGVCLQQGRTNARTMHVTKNAFENSACNGESLPPVKPLIPTVKIIHLEEVRENAFANIQQQKNQTCTTFARRLTLEHWHSVADIVSWFYHDASSAPRSE